MIARRVLAGLLVLFAIAHSRDGTISSLYAPQLKRADSHARLGPMFGVAE